MALKALDKILNPYNPLAYKYPFTLTSTSSTDLD